LNAPRTLTEVKPEARATSRHRTLPKARNGEDKKITYRLRGLPSTCDRGAVEILANRALNLEKGVVVKVCSLADSPYPQQGKVATLEFSNTPSCLLPDAVRDEWIFDNIRGIEQEHNTAISLVFDTHFRGFTPLHSENDIHCEAE
jgi:hypothetical protein